MSPPPVPGPRGSRKRQAPSAAAAIMPMLAALFMADATASAKAPELLRMVPRVEVGRIAYGELTLRF